MRSMSDFLNVVSTNPPPMIYKEYEWAEEYSEYYNESSDTYMGDIIDSSGYQFFGETAFYQEASKGLIAGGILALVSGAFFMIMKLLNGGDGGGGSSSTPKTNKNPKKQQESKDKPKPEPVPEPKPASEKSDYKKPAELEEEESITFNVEIIINELKKLKNHSIDDIAMNGGDAALLQIIRGLEKVEEITDFMVGLVKAGKWDMFVYSENKDNVFIKKCNDLKEIVDKMHNDSKTYDRKDNSTYAKIDTIIQDFNKIDSVTKEIERKCKEGMKACKEERKKLINKEKSTEHVDRAYKTLNGIIRNVNYVCKTLQHAFSRVYESAMDREYLFPMNTSYYHPYAYYYKDYDPSHKDSKYWSFQFESDYHNPMSIEQTYDYFTSALAKSMSDIFKVENSNKITERDVIEIENTKSKPYKDLRVSLKKIAEGKHKAEKMFAWLEVAPIDKKYHKAFNEIQNVVMQGYNALEEFLQVPVREFLGMTKENCNIPQFKKLHTLYLNYFTKDGKERTRIVNKLNDEKSESSDDGKDHTSKNNSKTVDQFVENMSAISFKSFYDNIEREADDIYKTLYVPIAFEATRFRKTIYAIFDAYKKDSDEEDFVNDVHSLIVKYVYGSDSKLSNTIWKKIENVLDRIGYRSIDANPGDDISLSKTYWERPIPAKNPGDKKPDTIKTILQMPRVLKVNIDGSDKVLKLAGKCSYWTK